MQRREFLRLAGLSGIAMAGGIGSGARAGALAPRGAAASSSPYGRWVRRSGVPAFVYSADQYALPEAEWDPILSPKTRRHWVMVGNRAIRMQAANDGTVGIFDEGDGLRWLTAPDPEGTGFSVVFETSTQAFWSTNNAVGGGGEMPPLRTFGPTWFEVRDARAGLTLERLTLCPEGEVPWVLVRVRLSLAADVAPRTFVLNEHWALRPRFCNFLETAEQRREKAELAVTHTFHPQPGIITVNERFSFPEAGGDVGEAAKALIGPPATLVLEQLGAGARPTQAGFGHVPYATVFLTAGLMTLQPGEQRELWFRFGRATDDTVADPAALLRDSRRALARRLPRAGAARAPEARHEIPWHAALLTGGLAADRVLGGHTLNQGSAYAYTIGFNGAARDPLQHALPLVYLDPPRALSVLRNTCSWASTDGDLPYALDAKKQPQALGFRPSDQNLWALWLASEYAAATGDLAAFDAELAYHPARAAEPVPLREHLRRQFRFFVDQVGRGERDHVRILNADWNDVAIAESGVDRATMIARGSSVLNSAMASWVLAVFAGLASRLGETALASEATAQADELRALVAQAWNGRWFHRAYGPDVEPVGEHDLWLEVQPWAILCGAADATQAASLLATIAQGPRAGSPVGTRLRWPAPPGRVEAGTWGDGTGGGIWYAIEMTLVWAAAHVDPDLAWEAWRRMTLAAHTAAYPFIWEGTLSGPDSWNGPESTRPGRTWAAPPLIAMQQYPVNNNHSHAQPLLAYLRLLGVEPTPAGTLAVGGGGRFRSPTFRVGADGHGALTALGPVTVESAHGTVSGTAGSLRW